MVVIFSSKFDVSTHLVSFWLNKMGNEVKIIKKIGPELQCAVNIDNNRNYILLEGREVNNIWFRKTPKIESLVSSQLKKEIQEHINYENAAWLGTIFVAAQSEAHRKVLGKNLLSSNFEYISKALALVIAQKNGLLIPDTILTSEKQELTKFHKKHKKIISKPITSSIVLYSNGNKTSARMYSSLVNRSTIRRLDDNFNPSFFQKYIEKEYEVRIFIIEDKIFSAAIFSQQNPKTKVDFRNYDDALPNRVIPYVLPPEVSLKILNTLRHFGMNTASIDMMVDKKGNHYFLEINPVGQFGMVSDPCNYFIEKEIATYLNEKQ